MLQYELTDWYKGIGISLGLDRGLLVSHDGILLVGEGMGIGACSLQISGFTYFTSIKSISETADALVLVGSLDRRLEWAVLGVRSRLLTSILEFITTYIYMKHENKQQRMLKYGSLFRRFFRVTPNFVNVSPRAEVMISYTAGQDKIDVEVSYKAKKPGGRLFIMNELDGNIFAEGITDGVRTPPPTGWQKVSGTCELYSCSNKLSFTISERHIPENVLGTIYWGRESCRDYCWAGFESKLTCSAKEFDNYKYTIIFQEARK